MKTKNILRILIVTALILLIPLLGNWPWTLSDFVIMGILIIGTGLTYELVVSKVGRKNRVVVATVLLLAFIVIWAELAVGLFGSPLAGN